MVLRTAFRMVSSHQTRDLKCFADRYSIPWNLPTIFHPDLIATILQTYLLSLCVLLAHQSHVFPIGVVSTYNDSRKDLHNFAKCQGIVSVNDSRLPIRLQELVQAPLCFLRSFCFARIRLDPLGGQVLHHEWCRCDVCDGSQDDGRRTVSEQSVQRITSKGNCADISSRALEANRHGCT